MLFECKVPIWFLILCSAVMAWLVLGCESVREQVPQFGYQDAEFHAGRDIEREQGITRNADGWIKSDGARYRIVDGRCEWVVSVANITDMPRRASCSVVASFDNPAPGADTCIAARDDGQAILAPNSSGEISGSMQAPAGALRAFSRSIVQPAAAPQVSGPIVLRCVAIKGDVAILEWKATVVAVEQTFTASYGFPNGKRTSTTKTMTASSYDLVVVIYGQDGKTEIARDTARVVGDRDHRVSACQRLEVPIDKAADIGRVTVQWDAVKVETSVAPKTKLMRVAAYCPCAKCCGRGAIGLTAIGTDAYDRGVATDWRCLPHGTLVVVPGYGSAVRVDDTGGALRKAWSSRREPGLEVRFESHAQARAWGVRWLEVEILEG